MSKHHAQMDRRRWQKLRRACFDRDGYRCVKCGRAGRLECDHVQPLHLAGAEWELSNTQTLCRGCHIGKTRLENSQRIPWPERDKWLDFVEARLSN